MRGIRTVIRSTCGIGRQVQVEMFRQTLLVKPNSFGDAVLVSRGQPRNRTVKPINIRSPWPFPWPTTQGALRSVLTHTHKYPWVWLRDTSKRQLKVVQIHTQSVVANRLDGMT